MNARNVFPNEAAATRAGTFYAALCGQPWALKRNEYPIVKAQSEGVNSGGGFLVPSEISDRIIELRDQRGLFRANAYVEAMASDSVSIPRRTGGLTAYFPVAENAALTESQATWGDSVTLTAKKIATLTRTSSELQEDAAPRFGAAITREIAYAMSAKEDDCGFNGDGSGSYGGIRGVTVLLKDGSHNAGKVTATSGHDLLSEVDAVDLANLVAALPSYATQGAKFFTSPVGFALVFCRLAAGNGGIQMMPVNGVMRPHFWGFEILTTSLLPNVATTLNGSIMLLLGDMNLSSSIGSRGGIEIKQSSQRLLDLDQILWRGRERMDIVNHDLGDNTVAGPVVGLLGN